VARTAKSVFDGAGVNANIRCADSVRRADRDFDWRSIDASRQPGQAPEQFHKVSGADPVVFFAAHFAGRHFPASLLLPAQRRARRSDGRSAVSSVTRRRESGGSTPIAFKRLSSAALQTPHGLRRSAAIKRNSCSARFAVESLVQWPPGRGFR
jgi:hypothetical protein